MKRLGITVLMEQFCLVDTVENPAASDFGDIVVAHINYLHIFSDSVNKNIWYQEENEDILGSNFTCSSNLSWLFSLLHASNINGHDRKWTNLWKGEVIVTSYSVPLADQATSTVTWYPTHSDNPGSDKTSPCPILLMPCAWLGSARYQF